MPSLFDPCKGIHSSAPRKTIRMQDVRQKFSALNYAQAGTAEIRGVHRIYSVVFNGRQLRIFRSEFPRLLDRAAEIESARHDDDYFRFGVFNVLDSHAHGIFPLSAKRIDAAGDFEKFRNPMAAAKERIDPFSAENAGNFGI